VFKLLFTQIEKIPERNFINRLHLTILAQENSQRVGGDFRQKMAFLA